MNLLFSDYSKDYYIKLLQDGLMLHSDVLSVYESVRIYKERNLGNSVDNWIKTYRILVNSIAIGQSENANLKTVMLSSLFYDIEQWKKYDNLVSTKDKVEAFLKENKIFISGTLIIDVIGVINIVNSNNKSGISLNCEQMIAIDAYNLEKIGAFGIYNYIKYAQINNETLDTLLDAVKEIDNIIFYTKTAKLYSKPLINYTLDYFRHLQASSMPYRSTKYNNL